MRPPLYLSISSEFDYNFNDKKNKSAINQSDKYLIIHRFHSVNKITGFNESINLLITNIGALLYTKSTKLIRPILDVYIELIKLQENNPA